VRTVLTTAKTSSVTHGTRVKVLRHVRVGTGRRGFPESREVVGRRRDLSGQQVVEVVVEVSVEISAQTFHATAVPRRQRHGHSRRCDKRKTKRYSPNGCSMRPESCGQRLRDCRNSKSFFIVVLSNPKLHFLNSPLNLKGTNLGQCLKLNVYISHLSWISLLK